MSFEQGRETLDRVETTPARNSGTSTSASHLDNELPPTPKQAQEQPSSPLDPEARERMSTVMQSDIGISTLLNRLKQSVSSARDFAGFLKERSSIEEKHAQSLKRLSRGTHEVIRRPESKGGSFASNFEDMTKVHDRMADNGLQFANALYQMHDELQEITAKCERDRKQWKQTGLDHEKRVQDAESAMNKAKAKYQNLAESYDRARTGEKQSGKFGIKAPKEEELHRKLEAADGEYASKVQTAQASRQDLVTTHRPQAVRALENAITECDAALTLQLSKYAALSEKMLLGNGLCVSPLRSQAAGASKSLREIAQSVDNHRDFHDYIMSFSNKAGTRQPEIKYEKHPSLAPQQQRPNQPPPQQSFDTSQPQLGTPERTKIYDSYQQSHPPSHSGQVSGVMPYQPPGSGPMSSNQPSPYSPQGPNYNMPQQPPQLPQIGSLGNGRGQSDLRSASGPPVDPRHSPLSSSRPDQFSPRPNQDQSSQDGPTPSYGSGALGPDSLTDTRTGPMNSEHGGYGRGPASSYTTGGPGRPPGSSDEFTHRGPTQSQVQSNEPPRQAFPDNRGPSSSELGGAPNSRGPSLGQQSEFEQDSRPPQTTGLRPQGPVGSGGPGGSAYSQPPYRSVSPSPQNGHGYRGASGPVGAAALPSNQRRAEMQKQNLPALKPVFGVSLDELFRRDNTAVPGIVYQCVQAVDLFGLDTEGIYRTSGSAPHIMEMKALFDHDSNLVDFRNPATFHHDIASVTTLLKQFCRDLPDPILTSAAYGQFIAAAKIDDDHIRRDSLHAIINALPDPNYATMRVLALHLHRVSKHSEKNRMTASNLAICLGPTIMGQSSPHGGGMPATGNAAADIKDAGWQARVVETILNNTLQIFDDDENE